MGVNKLLKAGIDGEKEQLAKASVRSEKTTGKNNSKPQEIPSLFVEESVAPVTDVPAAKRNPSGRPTNESKGKKRRKQYTITLVPDDYDMIMEKAEAEGISFAKYIERAAKTYIRNHESE